MISRVMAVTAGLVMSTGLLVSTAVTPVPAAAAPLTADPGTAGRAASQDPVDQAQLQVRDLQAEVARVAADLTAGTERLDSGRAHLAALRLDARAARDGADAAAAAAALAHTRLGDLVGASYRFPLPSDLVLALSRPQDGIGGAVLLNAQLDHVRGSQQDLLATARARSSVAHQLALRADALESAAAATAADLSRQVDALQTRAGEARTRLEAAAQELARAQAARQAALEQAAREAAAAEAARLAEAARAAEAARQAAAREGAARQASAAQAAHAAQAAQAAQAAGQQAASQAAASRAAASRAGLSAGCGARSTAGYANGLLPDSVLCPLSVGGGARLRSDAAAAFERLNAARPMCVTDSYRSYSQQVDVYQRKPDLAAIPGTSNHGWGIAVDFGCGVEQFGSAAYLWMKANAGRYGWVHPAWAEPGGGKPEPWHWEFTG